MSLDINLVKVAAASRGEAQVIQSLLPDGGADPKIHVLLDAMNRYYETYPKHSKLDWVTFLPLFNKLNPHLKSDDKIVFNAILKQAAVPAPDGVQVNLISDLQTRRLSRNIASFIDRYEEGGDIELGLAISEAVDTWKLGTQTHETAWNATPIENLLDLMEEDSGLQWRLQCLRDSMKGLRGGHFLIVGARPDTGKTSFLASELTYMAKQLPDDRTVLWLNNEGTSNEIIPRIWQAALGCTLEQLHEKRRNGTLRREYADTIGGVERIRVCDIHGWTMAQCERVIHEVQPGLVAFDMMDNIRSSMQGESRQDLVLERLYQRGRELAVLHDFVGVATSQVSADGDGELFPKMANLKDSRTGKAGACDAVVMLGANHDPAMRSVRGVSTPKNKLAKAGAPRDPRAEVQFLFHQARLVMIGDTEASDLEGE